MPFSRWPAKCRGNSVPLSKHYGGHGAKVMKAMKEQYGEKKGEEVFYATENKRKKHGARKMLKGK